MTPRSIAERLGGDVANPIFENFPDTFPAFHWHNDMPGIPAGAVLLAKSSGCSQQAFRYGDCTYGLDFIWT
jgi:GMP synthase (glutamine-hydrolysing)